DALEVLPALPGCDAGDDVGPVVAVAKRVERALAPGRTLDDELCVVVDDDRHQRCDFRALRTSLTSVQAAPSSVIRSASSPLTRSASSPSQPVRPSQRSEEHTSELHSPYDI